MEDIQAKAIKIISEKLGKSSVNITPDSHLVNDLQLDSLDTVEIIMEFEKEFSIIIPDDEAEKIRTVNEIVAFIKQKQKEEKEEKEKEKEAKEAKK